MSCFIRMIKEFISVTSHASPTPLSQTATHSRTPSPIERDVLYGRLPFIKRSKKVIVDSFSLRVYSTRGFKSQVAEGVNFIVFKTHYDWLYVYYMHLHNSLLSRR